MKSKMPYKVHIDKELVVRSFLEWAKIDAPSSKEGNIAKVIEQKLLNMGFTVQFDSAHEEFDGQVGNLIAHWPGTDPSIPPLFLSTHMDTVLPTANLVPVIRDGVIYSDGTTILGADDRAALTAYLQGIEYIQKHNIPCGPIELILTVCEQQGLKGARYLDYSKVQSQFGYIFDSDGDVGQIITRGPFSSKFHIEILGKASHIGLNPEDGVSAFLVGADVLKAIPQGKLEGNVLANVGIIEGGDLSSIIPGYLKMTGEVRAFTQENLDNTLDDIYLKASQAIQPHGAKLNYSIEKKYVGFNIDRNHLLVENAIQSFVDEEIPYYFTETLGGADTNTLNENGLTCITLGNGFKNLHTFQEHISIDNLVNAVKTTVQLILKWRDSHQ
ncbi:M20/M25/M40 family metallo-hydrolase [Lysinibacillus endophyticus]|uniref:M20/M25/M40 family metallo-hydrolase n=1 Tax=Ureibacillus endophyticus TaxID=1978490 RepID=UPI00313633F5